jgi:hypothetical protein
MKNYGQLFIGLIIGLLIGGYGEKLYLTPVDENKLVFATVNGHPITGLEVLENAKNELQNVEIRNYEIKRGTTMALIESYLLSEEAKKQGVEDPAALRKKLVADIKNLEISNSEIEAYLTQANLNRKILTSANINGIKLQIQNRKISKSYGEMLAGLIAAADINFKIKNPSQHLLAGPPQFNKETFFAGTLDSNRKIHLVTTYRCPLCSMAAQRALEVAKSLKDKIAIHIRFLVDAAPDSFGYHEIEASFCAGDQGKFSDYFLKLMSKPLASEAELLKAAGETGLRVEDMASCLSTHKFSKQVDAEIQFGKQNQDIELPAFNADGVSLQATSPLDELISKLR